MRGLVFQIGLLLALSLAALTSVLGGLGYLQARGNGLAGGVLLPPARQLAAMVGQIEAAPPGRLPGLLAAFTSRSQTVFVVTTPPEPGRDVRMPGLRLALASYRRALDGRAVSVSVEGGEGDEPRLIRRRDRFWLANPLRLAIGLKDGRTAIVEVRGWRAGQFDGLRLSMIALAAAIVIGAAALFLLLRQLGPLRRLAGAVDRFGASAAPETLPEQGSKEVRQLIGAFNRLQGQVGALVAGRSRMMAAIGHDLGTYLTRLRLRTEFIEDPDQRRKAIDDIAGMHAMMTDTLTLAKLDHDAEPAEPADLGALLRDRADGLPDPAKVSLSLPAAPVMAPVRRTALSRAVDNLISNALKYGGAVEITLRAVGGTAEMLFEDRGPGIPAAERQAVLEPFYRRDGARNLDEPGFGLGLAIVADVVARHAGTIALEDRDGGGLRARVRLPLAAKQ